MLLIIYCRHPLKDCNAWPNGHKTPNYPRVGTMVLGVVRILNLNIIP